VQAGIPGRTDSHAHRNGPHEGCPQKRDRAEGVVLYHSEFNTRYVACGNMSQEPLDQAHRRPVVKVLSCCNGLFNPPRIHTRRSHTNGVTCGCPDCKNCKECQFRMDSLTFKENTEYEIIVSKLRLDVDRKTWVAGYPFNSMVERLIDNYNQARGYMSKMEARLLKMGRLDEFNRQFQDNVDRGVFKAVPRKEADRYKVPVNYISMVEVFKTGPHATTPLRICMNSSMKKAAQAVRGESERLPPEGTTGSGRPVHGHPWYTGAKVAFTKDISKFYQCVEAAESAQHVRRILWRFGEGAREPTIFVTTRVNYGASP
jgi:hypothetical protein